MSMTKRNSLAARTPCGGTVTARPSAGRQGRAAEPGLWLRLRGRLALMAALRRQRRALAEMDETRLADLGISPDEARAEAARAAWDVPGHWRR